MIQLPKLKVTGQGHGFNLEFCVHTISPEPLGDFHYLLYPKIPLVRGCAEHMNQLPRLKVTGQCHVI